MRHWCGRSAALALLFAVSCSLSSLDDLQGGTAAATDRCVEKVDCSGCQSCAKLCTCTDAPDFDQCYQSCQNKVDASGGSGGSGGSGATTGGGGGAGGSGATGGGLGSCDDPASDSCTICLQQQCCTELTTCTETPDCVEFVNCLAVYCSDDPSAECAAANCQAHYGGFDEYTALATCAQASCDPVCFQP